MALRSEAVRVHRRDSSLTSHVNGCLSREGGPDLPQSIGMWRARSSIVYKPPALTGRRLMPATKGSADRMPTVGFSTESSYSVCPGPPEKTRTGKWGRGGTTICRSA